jgi:2-dehydro-3-deoxyphosphogluconate aldolase/(4S)-4-hydroxy-2-oxoglutarate aldolase
MNDALIAILQRAPVVPVIVLHELEHAIPLAQSLVAGGLPVLEVTLRTPVALAAVKAMRRAVPGAIVGVGTITSAEQFIAARDAGAQFGVSPGLTPALAAASRDFGQPYLPGVMTATELMQARELGFACCKLFPAQQAGGIGMLKALHAVFPEVRFCPTGGISPDNAPEFLALPNVLCVGGSWVAPEALVRAAAWAEISRLAGEAASLLRAAVPRPATGIAGAG